MKSTDLAPMIDYTALSPTLSKEEIIVICDEARGANYATVCLDPSQVTLAVGLLDGSSTAVSTVVGYASTRMTTREKVAIATAAIDHGADEVEISMDVSGILTGNEEAIYRDLLPVAKAVAKNPNALLRVSVDLSVLDDSQRQKAVNLAIEGGAHYVVARTSVHGGSVTPSDISTVRGAAVSAIGVAVGNVTSDAQALDLLSAGATRLGRERA